MNAGRARKFCTTDDEKLDLARHLTNVSLRNEDGSFNKDSAESSSSSSQRRHQQEVAVEEEEEQVNLCTTVLLCLSRVESRAQQDPHLRRSPWRLLPHNL